MIALCMQDKLKLLQIYIVNLPKLTMEFSI